MVARWAHNPQVGDSNSPRATAVLAICRRLQLDVYIRKFSAINAKTNACRARGLARPLPSSLHLTNRRVENEIKK